MKRLALLKKSIGVALAVLLLSCFVPTAFAQQVGTHLGEGDISFQIAIMDMLKSKGAGADFPVTIMVDVGTSEAQLNSLAAAAQRNGFFAIVRINGVCTGANASSIATKVRAAFGPSTPIEYGNEVNNKTVECANYSAYVSEYSPIKSMSNVGPSALDFYNGDYPASGFFNVAGNLYSGDDVYFANAYGCIGGTIDNCDVAGTSTQVTGYENVKNRGTFYLTEFSLSPGDRSASAPDNDLKSVVEFIQTRSAETGAAKITPLIRNVCNEDGDWLLYVDGKVFTRTGAEVDVESCSVTDSDKAPYYLYPIESLQEEIGDPKAHAAAISEELVDQGYQVSCTTPQALFRASFEDWEQFREFIDPSLASADTKTIASRLNMDFSAAKYPLFRSQQPARAFNGSIESYFGYLETSPVIDPIQQPLLSAPVYRLLSLEDQCEHKKNLLRTIDSMCNKLEDPSSCALYQPIPNSSFTTQTLFPQIDSVQCDQLDQTKDVDKAILNTPLFLDKAYRLGFLVFTTQQRGSVGLNPNNGWDFLLGDDPTGQPEHWVHVIAFKLPDVGTNDMVDVENQYYDPLKITRDALSTTAVQEERDKEYTEQRDTMREGAEFASSLNFPSDQARVNCAGPACQDPMGRALVNLINSGAESLDDTCDLEVDAQKEQLSKFERGAEINTNMGLTSSSTEDGGQDNNLGTLFKTSFQLLTNIFKQPESSQENPSEFEQNANMTIVPQKYVDGAFIQPSKFDTYLIYPVGYDLHTVEETLAGVVKTNEQLAEMDDIKEYEPYFILEGVNRDFQNDNQQQEYTLLDGQGDCVATGGIDPVTGLPLPPGTCQREMEYKTLFYLNDDDGDDNVDSIEFEPRVEGGILGHLMRDVQKSLRRYGTRGWNFINSCKSTEQYLLGKCDVNATTDPNTALSDLSGQCSELYGDKEMTVYDVKATFEKVVAAANAKRPGDRRFAQTLWGVLEIEGSPYLREMRTLAIGSTKAIACDSTINTCGAVGPMQIIQGACVKDSCPSPAKDMLKTFVRPNELCSFDTAIEFAADYLNDNFNEENADPYAAAAGAYHGVGDCSEAPNNNPVQGCNGMNYCDCAANGFDQRFDNMAAQYGYIDIN